MEALIIGGSSGLGLELAHILAKDYHVTITGRQNPGTAAATFYRLDLAKPTLGTRLDQLLRAVPRVDLLVYAAGFYQEGRISELSDVALTTMQRVGLLAPALLLQRLLQRQVDLPGFIAITSTSQWTPRRLEPIYTAAKAGLGMLANSVALDERVGRVLVAGPSGMQTPFWAQSRRDVTGMLDPRWVAEQILTLYSAPFDYQCARILRDPARIEVLETR
ncbi:MAG: SDR family oxidoreductase [Deltaproteobacteria bacterium]|nr:SDR family oxidoreductase [Deltaproteobacteria bacterium]